MVTNLVLALAIANSAVIKPEERPVFVTGAIEAIAAKDAGRITGSFREIVEVTADGPRSITAEQAVELLSVCSQKDVLSLSNNVYGIDFECPSRRLVAEGCDSGDLAVIVDGDRRSFAVGHSRKVNDSCPVFAPPPPPPPVDESIAVRFAQALLHNDDAAVSQLVSNETLVSSERRYPGTSTIEQKGNSNGVGELRKQYGSIIREMGQPASVSCEKQQLFEMCKFTFSEGGKVLLAFLNTKGSGMYLVRFIYAVRP